MACPQCDYEKINRHPENSNIWFWGDGRSDGIPIQIAYCPNCGYNLEGGTRLDELNKMSEEVKRALDAQVLSTGVEPPLKVKILGQIYTIAKKDRQDVYLEHGDLRGKVVYDDAKIYIAESLNHGDYTSTIIHEVLHIIDRDFDLGLSEANVKRLAACLTTVITDNEKMIRKLFYRKPSANGMQSMIGDKLYGPGDDIPAAERRPDKI